MNVEVDSVVFVLRLALTGDEARAVVDAERLQALVRIGRAPQGRNGHALAAPKGKGFRALAAPKAKARHTCADCGRKFAYAGVLKKHVEREHAASAAS